MSDTRSKRSVRTLGRGARTQVSVSDRPASIVPEPGTVDLTNLEECADEVRRAALANDPGPEDPVDFHQLRARLEGAKHRLPPLYRETAFAPFVAQLDALGPQGFQDVLLSDPPRERAAGLMLDIAHAVLQNGERYRDKETDAFQEVVSDLYDGFLGAEDRAAVKAPDDEVVPALVKWGNPGFGPYTWPVDSTKTFGLEVAIVSLPPTNAVRGLLAWATLSHETVGHDVLHADRGLPAEMADLVRQNLAGDPAMGTLGLPSYWADRIDETASDVMGILSMGPAAAVGLIGYFRGLNAAFGGLARLRPDGPEGDPHPSDLLRAYLAAEVVRGLEFDRSEVWAGAIERQADIDAPATVRLADRTVPLAVGAESARRVGSIIATHPLQSLEGHALIDIQNWRNSDEVIARRLTVSLTSAEAPPPELTGTYYAAHVVAAAVASAVAAGADIPILFGRMQHVLKVMHDDNPSWGPLFVRHPGNLFRHPLYLRAARWSAVGPAAASLPRAAAAAATTKVTLKLSSTAEDVKAYLGDRQLYFSAGECAVELPSGHHILFWYAFGPPDATVQLEITAPAALKWSSGRNQIGSTMKNGWNHDFTT